MLKLSQLINLEVQLMRDADADPVVIRNRDRSIGQKLSKKKYSRPHLFLRWLASLGYSEAFLPGKYFSDSIRIIRYILFFSGLAAGLSAGSAVLHFDGSTPVNIVNFLAILLGLQFLTYFLFLLNLLPAKMKNSIPFIGDFYNVIRQVSFLIAKNSGHILGKFSNATTRLIFDNIHKVRMRQKLYKEIEKWLIIRLTQTFSIAFNLGALFICAYLVIFSDLAFAWNTTLELENSSFHNTIEQFSRPWQHIIPNAVPSLELIEKTRFFRLEGEYLMSPENQRTADVFILGGWWPFLIVSLITYGLLPRLLLSLFARWRFSQNLQRVPFDTADFNALFERLTTPIVETRNSNPGLQEKSAPSNAIPESAQFKPEGQKCLLVLWGECEIEDEQLHALVKQRFNWQFEMKLEAGLLDIHSDEKAITKIRQNEQKDLPILILVESWETPNKAIKHFLQALRKNITPERQIVVGLVDTISFQQSASSEWQAWNKELSQLADPYLRVVALIEEAA